MNSSVHLALFEEDRLDQVTEALDRLRSLGVKEEEMSVISGIPYSDKILGRPMSWTRVPYIAIGGALTGFLVALALSMGTPLLYPVRVGNQPFLPIPTTVVVVFELTMLGLLISTFIGVFVETISPSYGPKGYHPKISDGQIGILFSCPGCADETMHERLGELGAKILHGSEVQR